MPRKRMKTSLTVEQLKSKLAYDSASGEFIRIRGVSGWAAGSRVGCDRGDGRVVVHINGKLYLRARLAWFYVYGYWPKNELDHINRDRSDDRIENLREATSSQNHANSGLRSDNKSGVKGVQWDSSRLKWSVRIGRNNKYIGRFDSLEEAKAAYLSAARKRFGEFAGIADAF